ncbi:MAG TPA: sodium/proline symporter [Bacteroidota bacterium]|nr:sodium/proline symporter [Bacteroidota bacterium]
MQDQSTLQQSATDPWALLAFCGYLLSVIIVGVYASRFASRGLAEFFLGGRKLKSFVVALSAVASGRSAWLLVGVTGMAYARGVSTLWSVVGYTVAELILFLTVAVRLRQYSGEKGSITLPDYFETRFNDSSHLLRGVSALIILIFMVIYVAAQLDGGGKTFSASFGITHFQGVLFTAFIVWLYTLLGGFLAVALTDVLQAIFMLVGLLVVPVIAILNFGGFSAVSQAVRLQDATMLDPFALTVGALIGFLGIGLGSTGNPHIIVRYMSIHDPTKLRISAVWGTVWNVLMATGALCIGLVGRAYFPEQSSLPNGDTENLFPYLAQLHLHPFFFGLVIAAVVAAIMSTADSQLLVAASSVVRDLYQQLLLKGKEISQERLVLLSRFMITVLIIAAIALREIASDLVFWLVLFAWGGLGASFGPALILSLYWKGTTRWGVLAGLLVGTTVTIVWNQTPALKAQLYELIPAFFLSLFLIIIISKLTRSEQKPEERDSTWPEDTKV